MKTFIAPESVMPMSLKISSACRFFSESTRAVIVAVMLNALLCVRNAYNYTTTAAFCVITSAKIIAHELIPK